VSVVAPAIGAGEPADVVTFDEHVKPILRKHCFSCHNKETAKASLDVTSYAGILAGSMSGKVLVAGSPGDSPLYLVVTHQEEPFMPQAVPKLADKDLNTIKRWIDGGLLEKASSVLAAATNERPAGQKANTPAANVKPSAAAVPADSSPKMAAMPLAKTASAAPTEAARRPATLSALAASPTAPILAVSGREEARLLDAVSLAPRSVLPFPDGDLFVLRYSRDGRLLLGAGGAGAKSGRIVLWNVGSGKPVAELGDDEHDAVLAADVSPDGTLVALGGPGKVVKVVSTADGKSSYTLRKHTDWILALEFSPDGLLLATGDRNGGLLVTEARTGKEFATLRGHKGAITNLAWRPDGDVLASVSEDGTLKLWDLHSLALLRTTDAHKGGALGLAFAPDGRVATCGRDRLVKLWDAEGRMLRTFEPMRDQALKLAFVDKGRMIVAGDWSGEIRSFETPQNSETSTPAPTLVATLPKATEVSGKGTTDKKDSNSADETRASAVRALEIAQAELKAAEAAIADARNASEQLRGLIARVGKSSKDAREKASHSKQITEDARAQIAGKLADSSAADAARALVEEKRSLRKSLATVTYGAKAISDKYPRDETLRRTAAQSADLLRVLDDDLKIAEQALRAATLSAQQPDSRQSGTSPAKGDGSAK
jgi:WD40 repeat protein